MKHEFKKIVFVEVINAGLLELEFDCGLKKIVDLTPIMRGPIFGELNDPEIFNQVSVDHEIGTICWPNGADFDPDTLFCWEEVVEDLSGHLQST